MLKQAATAILIALTAAGCSHPAGSAAAAVPVAPSPPPVPVISGSWSGLYDLASCHATGDWWNANCLAVRRLGWGSFAFQLTQDGDRVSGTVTKPGPGIAQIIVSGRITAAGDLSLEELRLADLTPLDSYTESTDTIWKLRLNADNTLAGELTIDGSGTGGRAGAMHLEATIRSSSVTRQ